MHHDAPPPGPHGQFHAAVPHDPDAGRRPSRLEHDTPDPELAHRKRHGQRRHIIRAQRRRRPAAHAPGHPRGLPDTRLTLASSENTAHLAGTWQPPDLHGLILPAGWSSPRRQPGQVAGPRLRVRDLAIKKSAPAGVRGSSGARRGPRRHLQAPRLAAIRSRGPTWASRRDRRPRRRTARSALPQLARAPRIRPQRGRRREPYHLDPLGADPAQVDEHTPGARDLGVDGRIVVGRSIAGVPRQRAERPLDRRVQATAAPGGRSRWSPP
jgi:hypothetical protein